MKNLKSFKEEDYNLEMIDTPKNTIVKNNEYFKPFTIEVISWKKRHNQAILMLELKDLFNTIYKKGVRDGQLSSDSNFIQGFKMKMRDILLSNLNAEEKLQELNKLRQS